MVHLQHSLNARAYWRDLVLPDLAKSAARGFNQVPEARCRSSLPGGRAPSASCGGRCGSGRGGRVARSELEAYRSSSCAAIVVLA